MGLTWHRNVAVVTAGDGTQSLSVTIPANGNPSGRSDPADTITIYPNDRTNGAAKVIYTLIGGSAGTLSCVPKPGYSLPTGFSVSTAGNTLTIDDSDAAAESVSFSYYIKSGTISTTDPMIHNEPPPID